MSQEYNATVIKNEIISDNLCVLTIKPDFEISHFRPGQFTVLGLKAKEKVVPEATNQIKHDDPEKMIKKAYSVLSSPEQHHYLEFYIALVPDGNLTPRLFALESDDRIYVGEKFTGQFTLDKIPEDKNLLMIGTGTGLAPFVSMIRTHVCEMKRQIVVLHGARFSYDLGFYSELSMMDNHCKNFHYIPAVSRPQTDANWGGATGRVTEVIKKGIIEEKTELQLTPQNFDVLLCGNPDMINDMIIYLKTLGFKEHSKEERGQIHTEKYW